MRQRPIEATVWSEGTAPREVYPNGIHATIAEHLNEHEGFVAEAVSIDDPDQGVSSEVLDRSDVLLWWGHLRHADVSDETVDRVERHVREEGVGFVGLHSGHYARPFKRLIGTSGDLGAVRDEGETERLSVVSPSHPIVEGISDFSISQVEMFGEPYDIPDPDAVVFESTFENGGEFRSGVTFTFDAGRGFYFRPGHEEYRIYHDPTVRKILENAAKWAADTAE